MSVRSLVATISIALSMAGAVQAAPSGQNHTLGTQLPASVNGRYWVITCQSDFVFAIYVKQAFLEDRFSALPILIMPA